MTETEAILYLEDIISNQSKGHQLYLEETLLLSDFYIRNEDFESALVVLNNALLLETNILNKQLLLEIYFAISNIYTRLFKYDIAINYLDSALEHYDARQVEPDLYFKILFNKLNLYTLSEYYEIAYKFYKEVEPILATTPFREEHKYYLKGVLGIILKGIERYDDALEQMHECRNFLKTSTNIKFYHALGKSLGDCYLLIGDLEKAEIYLLESYEHFTSDIYPVKDYLFLKVILDFLINLYAKKEDVAQEKKYLYVQIEYLKEFIKNNNNVLNQFHWKLTIQKAKSENEILKEKNILKEQFLNLVSHDMKSPIGGIIGMIEIMQNTELSNEQRDCLQYMQRSSEDLLKFVNDLLDISKINAGKMDLIMKPMILDEMIADLSYTMQSQLLKNNNTCEVNNEVEVGSSYTTDRFRLYQILMNLCTNANKFTQNGKITLGIKEIQNANNKHTLEFQISDTGTGISPENQSKIFETFSQLDNDVNHLEKGSGLGLSIVSKLLALFHGDIKLESAIGKGSTFTFHIPVEKQILKPIQNSSIPTLQETIKNKKLLLIEDNITMQFYIQKIASDLGMQVTTIDSISEFIKLFEASDFRFDYILIDNHLTDGDSLEILEYIQAKNPMILQNVKCISISADLDIMLVENLKKYNVLQYIQKPFNSEKLLHALINEK